MEKCLHANTTFNIERVISQDLGDPPMPDYREVVFCLDCGQRLPEPEPDEQDIPF